MIRVTKSALECVWCTGNL